MFGKKKKSEDKRLPEIPPSMKSLPSITDYQKSNFEHPVMEKPFEDEDKIHGLPSFPDSPMKKGFSQSAIKDAVETPERDEFTEENLPNLPHFPEEEKNTREMEEWKPNIPVPKKIERAPAKNSPNKPIFVKLEKFKEAKESLDLINQKVGDMDNLLKMVKEIKEKENKEIKELKKEIEKVKVRISSINQDIFENVY